MPIPPMPSQLDQYESGDHVGVWRGFQDAPDLYRDTAMDVARATMRRVRHNAEVLAERLTASGWHALTGAMVSPRQTLPVPGQAEAEDLCGAPLPLAIQAFWVEVGGLDYIWDYRRRETYPDLFGGLSIFELDPLCVFPPLITAEMDQRKDASDDEPDARHAVYHLPLAPDDYHKANISGGSPYGIELPDTSIDPMFVGGHFSMRFTSYLRLAFRWGGFPGLAILPRSTKVDARVAMLTEGLLPF